MRRAIAGARALVTGASGGLGRALAIELARRGASIVLLARREEKLREVAAQIQALGGGSKNVEIVVGDVTRPIARREALQTAAQAFGGLDILINNAGVGAIGRFESASSDRLRQVFETNFFAAAELTREAIPLLKLGRHPIIVNIGSILGYRATPQNSEYCASKFALRGWSESLRVELAGSSIDVLLATLGPTTTDFWDHLVDQQGEAPWSTRIALPADRAAHEIIRALECGSREIIPGFRARCFVRLSDLFPRLFDRILRRYA